MHLYKPDALVDKGAIRRNQKMSAYDVLVNTSSPQNSNTSFDPKLEDRLDATEEET